MLLGVQNPINCLITQHGIARDSPEIRHLPLLTSLPSTQPALFITFKVRCAVGLSHLFSLWLNLCFRKRYSDIFTLNWLVFFSVLKTLEKLLT